jgi:hypothetical protein
VIQREKLRKSGISILASYIEVTLKFVSYPYGTAASDAAGIGSTTKNGQTAVRKET